MAQPAPPPDGTVAAHADWSMDPRKRWMTLARLSGGTWRAEAPAPVGDAVDALRRPAGRTLVPLGDAPGPGEGEPLAGGELLDPERAEPVWAALRHAVADRLASARLRGRA